MAGTAEAARGSVANQLFERVAAFADRVTGHRLGEYAANSGFVKQSVSPFDNFGAVLAAGSRPLPIGQALKEAAIFTVEEARERLASFIEGRFVPEGLSELIEYLGERFMRLETRIVGGYAANFLVDTKSNQAIPAVQVDPRLSHAAILATGLRRALRERIGHESPADAFNSWQGMGLVLDDAPGGIGYTVSGNTAWFGKIHAIASADRERNLAIVKEARSRGVELVLPRMQEGPVADLVAGMPILARTQSMKAAEIDPRLAHSALVAEFAARDPEGRRRGMAETYGRMGDRSRSAARFGNEGTVPSPAASGTVRPAAGQAPVPQARRAAAAPSRPDRQDSNVIFIESFHRKFVRPSHEAEEDLSLGFGGLGGEQGERDLVIRRAGGEGGKLCVFDRDLSEEVPIAPSALPVGRYDREDANGKKEGYTDVAKGGGLKHFDLDGQQLRRRPAPAAAAEPAADEGFQPPVPAFRR